MNGRFPVLAIVLLLSLTANAQERSWLERLGDSLTFASSDGAFRARVSGTIEVDGYYSPTTRADLRFFDGTDETLMAPRLCLFLDAQWGERVYAFAQTRVDRGLDPADEPLEVRLDEFALRWDLAGDGRATLQAGKFATMVGAWSKRHLSWDNPFVTAPLIYEGQTPMWDRRATVSISQVLRRAHILPLSGDAGVASDKHQRLPIIWGPAYAAGAAAAGSIGRLDYALELKNAAPGSRPESWEFDEKPWGPPAVGGRIGFRPSVRWDLGVSGSTGCYLTRDAIPTTPPGSEARDHRQDILGFDVAYSHRHLQVWAEAVAARYTAPGVEDLNTIAYYIEAKYKFAPRLAGALRWNQQFYSDVDDPIGGRTPWGREVFRLDVVLIARLTHQCQVKVQYSPQHEDPAPETVSHAIALQFVARF